MEKARKFEETAQGSTPNTKKTFTDAANKKRKEAAEAVKQANELNMKAIALDSDED